MISDRELFAVATNMDVNCVSHQAVRLDCVILLSKSINRARTDLDVAASIVILSIVWHHGRISVMVIEERVNSYACLTRLKDPKTTVRRSRDTGDGTR